MIENSTNLNDFLPLLWPQLMGIPYFISQNKTSDEDMVCVEEFYQGDESCYCSHKYTAGEFWLSLFLGIISGLLQALGLVAMKQSEKKDYSHDNTQCWRWLLTLCVVIVRTCKTTNDTDKMLEEKICKTLKKVLKWTGRGIWLLSYFYVFLKKDTFSRKDMLSSFKLIGTFSWVICIHFLFFTKKSITKSKLIIIMGCLLGGVQMTSKFTRPEENYDSIVEKLKTNIWVYIYCVALVLTAGIVNIIQMVVMKIKIKYLSENETLSIEEHKLLWLFISNLLTAASYNSISVISFRLVELWWKSKKHIATGSFIASIADDEKVIWLILGFFVILYGFRKLHAAFNQCPDIFSIVAFEGFNIITYCVTNYVFYQKLPTTFGARVETFVGATILLISLFTLFRDALKEELLKKARKKNLLEKMKNRPKAPTFSFRQRIVHFKWAKIFYEDVLGCQILLENKLKEKEDEDGPSNSRRLYVEKNYAVVNFFGQKLLLDIPPKANVEKTPESQEWNKSSLEFSIILPEEEWNELQKRIILFQRNPQDIPKIIIQKDQEEDPKMVIVHDGINGTMITLKCYDENVENVISNANENDTDMI